MALLALTQDNIDFIKRGLKPSYPSVKSSPLSEAIAAACGFRTNISLVSSLRATDLRHPDLTEVNAGRFIARLTELGYPALDGTVLPSMVRSQEMPKRIWLVRKSGDRSLLNDWYRECQQRDIPYVYITTRRTLAQVDWDYFALDPKHDHWLGKGNPDLDNKMFREIRHLAEARPGNLLRFGSAMVGGVKDVPIEWATEIAEVAFKMQYDAIREGERQAVA